MNTKIRHNLFITILINLCIILFAQSVSAQTLNSSDYKQGNDFINIFLDCNHCHKDYLKQEITFVNYLREPQTADIHIIITKEANSSGGHQYYITLRGQNSFSGKLDTITFNTSPTQTTEEVRTELTKKLSLKLASLAVNTSAIDNISVNFKKSTSQVSNLITKDRWKNWVYRVSANTYMSGDANQNYKYLSSNFEGTKITNRIKLINRINTSYSRNMFKLGDNRLTAINKTYSAYHLFGKSLNEHWTLGEKFKLTHSTFSNHQRKLQVSPLVEYSLFPYSEAQRKQLRFQYALNFQNVHYIDTTIFNVIEENLIAQELKVGFETICKWGDLNLSVEYSNYLHDFELYNIDFNASFHIRVFKGFQIGYYGSFSMIHDQLNISRKGLSEQDILLRLKENSTKYSYYSGIQLRFTFGSLYSNIVNPRFDDI